MKATLTRIARSCYDRTFYEESVSDSVGTRLKAVYLILFVYTLLITLGLAQFVFDNRVAITNAPQSVSAFLKKAYPNDLIMRFENNQLSINKKEPYVLLAADQIAPGFAAEMGQKNLVVIDTRTNVESAKELDSLLVFMKNGFTITKQEDGSVDYHPYRMASETQQKRPQTVIFDSVTYGQIINKLQPIIKQLSSILFMLAALVGLFMIIVMPAFWLVSYLFTSSFVALIGYAVGRIIKRPHSLSFCFKTALYTGIPVMLLHQVAILFGLTSLENMWPLVALLSFTIFLPPAEAEASPANTPQVTP